MEAPRCCFLAPVPSSSAGHHRPESCGGPGGGKRCRDAGPPLTGPREAARDAGSRLPSFHGQAQPRSRRLSAPKPKGAAARPRYRSQGACGLPAPRMRTSRPAGRPAARCGSRTPSSSPRDCPYCAGALPQAAQPYHACASPPPRLPGGKLHGGVRCLKRPGVQPEPCGFFVPASPHPRSPPRMRHLRCFLGSCDCFRQNHLRRAAEGERGVRERPPAGAGGRQGCRGSRRVAAAPRKRTGPT